MQPFIQHLRDLCPGDLRSALHNKPSSLPPIQTNLIPSSQPAKKCEHYECEVRLHRSELAALQVLGPSRRSRLKSLYWCA
jgi:hypothetical protein